MTDYQFDSKESLQNEQTKERNAVAKAIHHDDPEGENLHQARLDQINAELRRRRMVAE